MAPITVSEPKRNYKPAPEGLHCAVCVDVIDRGEQQTPWGMKRKVELRWQIEEVVPESGKRHEVRAWFTASLNEKARLRQILEAWRGRKFTEEELQGFDLEKLIGVNCQLQVVHTQGDDGRVFSNVQAVVPAAKGAERMRPVDYVRDQDRAKAGNGNGNGVSEVDDGDVPF